MPFGLFECQPLPQWVKPATDIYQGQMTLFFSHLKSNESKINLDDVLNTSDINFDDHIKHPYAIVKILKKEGIQVNDMKSSWFATTM